VDVDPVVREAVGLGHDERHGEEVAEGQVVGRLTDLLGHRRVHGAEELGEGHRGDHVVGRELSGGTVVLGDDGDGPTTVVLDAHDPGLHLHRRALIRDDVAAALPHHARAVLRVLELLDQAGDLRALVPLAEHLHADRLPQGVLQRHALDALGREVGRDRRGRHAHSFSL
jgi:hypothetical protein